MTGLLGLVRNPDGRPPTSDTAPRIDYGAVVEAVHRLRKERNAMTLAEACGVVGVSYYEYRLALKHVATDEEAFSFEPFDRLTPAEKICGGGGC